MHTANIETAAFMMQIVHFNKITGFTVAAAAIQRGRLLLLLLLPVITCGLVCCPMFQTQISLSLLKDSR